LLDILLATGLVDEVDAGQPGPHEDTGLRQWEFHDLLFHARSRPGRNDSRLGRTFRFVGDIAPTPALRQPGSGPLITLGKPDMAQLRQSDVAFTEVVEARRSIRKFGSRALTLPQLGQFLYRTARVRAVHPADGKKLLYESTDRPYPSGGGCYELEIYAVVDRCEDLAPGVYRYDPLQHGLEAIESKPPVRNTLLDNAAQANGTGERPQVLFVLTARFQRLNWKYETMAYAAILKNVGVLYQTMYLVATAMGLAPCALGAGDPELLGAITGDAYWMESSVGEFMLGSLPDQPYSQF
jgi:SagB-type dehydrogenase family enzyme